MTAVSPDALLGAGVSLRRAGLAAFWKLATMLSDVRSQTRNNGGSTMRDAVDRLERKVDHVIDNQATQGERLAIVETRVEVAVLQAADAAHHAANVRNGLTVVPATRTPRKRAS